MPFDVRTYFDNGGVDGTPANQTDTSVLGPPSQVRFKTADDFNIDANDPIPIPAPGPPNFSFWKQLYLRIFGGTGTLVRNVKFFANNVAGFGVGINTLVGTNTPFPENSSVTQSGYEVATGSVGVSGDDMNFTINPGTGHSGVTTTADAFSFTSVAPLDMEINETGNIPVTEMQNIGDRTRYLVFQMDVDSTAAPGALTPETWTFQYEEI
jgi:hypothetical protein